MTLIFYTCFLPLTTYSLLLTADIMFDIKKLFRSFHHAFKGLILMYREEQNFRIHVACSLIVIFLAFLFRAEPMEIIILLIPISMLLVLEIINTVFERFVDIAKPRVHHYIAFIKDVMAGAVLIAALICALTTIIILFPYAVRMI